MLRRSFIRCTVASPLAAGSWLTDGLAAGSRLVRVVGPGPRPDFRRLRPAALAQMPLNGVGPLLSSAFYEPLTTFDHLGRLAPALARSWTSRRSGARWLLSLRPGVDGRAVARYLGGICSAQGPLRYSSWALETVGLVKRWELRGESVLAADLKFPVETFPRIVATLPYRVPGPVAGVYGPYALGPVSEDSGRWQVDLMPRTEGARLRVPGGNRIRVIAEPDPQIRVSMVRTGGADVALSVEGAGPRIVESGLPVRYRPDLFPVVVVRSPDDARERAALARALEAATDRAFVLRMAYGAYGVRGDGSVPARWSQPSPAVLSCPVGGGGEAGGAPPPSGLVLSVHSAEYLRLGFALCAAWRRHGLDIRARVHDGSPRSFWTQPLLLAPWALREDARIMLWGLSDPRRSGLAWSLGPDSALLSAMFAEPSAEGRRLALRRVLDHFRCGAPAVIPVLPDRVDLWRSEHSRSAPAPHGRHRRWLGGVQLRQLSMLA